MKVSTLKAEWLVDKDKTRTKIRKVLHKWSGTRQEGGMLGNSAEELGVSRMTLYRLIQDDKELKKYVADHDFRYQRMKRP